MKPKKPTNAIAQNKTSSYTVNFSKRQIAFNMGKVIGALCLVGPDSRFRAFTTNFRRSKSGRGFPYPFII